MILIAYLIPHSKLLYQPYLTGLILKITHLYLLDITSLGKHTRIDPSYFEDTDPHLLYFPSQIKIG